MKVTSSAVRLFIASAVCIGVSSAAASLAHAATITVNDTTDELNSDGSCSLREAVQAANTDTAIDGCTAGSGADVINVPAGTYTLTIAGDDDDNTGGDLDLVSDIELVGAGRATTILDGGAIDRLIDARCALDTNTGDCLPTTIRIAGFTIRNGNAQGRGGGVRNTGDAGPNALSPVTLLEDCHVTQNVAEFGGGVGDEGVLTIRNPLIDHNTCNYSFGCTGGGIDTFGVTTIQDSEIANNTATRDGGGVHNNAIMTVRRSLIHDNTSTGAGGGFVDINGHSVLENVTITGNTAGTVGGGIACADPSNDCDIAMSHSTVAFNAAASGGLGIHVYAGGTRVFTIKNSIVADNGLVDVAGAFVSNGYNIVQHVGSATGLSGGQDLTAVDPQLQALADNGGTLHSLAITGMSPAFDAGTCTDNASATVALDERSFPRPIGVTCDIGAYEVPGPKVTVISNEPAGAHCTAGGTRIAIGYDNDGNGTLTGAEVTSAQYACNGTNGATGSNGTNGTNGTNGADGADGADGIGTLIDTAPLAVGNSHCSNGGVRVDIGLDNGDGAGTARDEMLDADEIDVTRYVCNGIKGATGAVGAVGAVGVDGKSGADGKDGKDGSSAVTRVTTLKNGESSCANGGVLIEAGLDANGDGVLQTSEVSKSASVCTPKAPAAGGCSVVRPAAHQPGGLLAAAFSLLVGAFLRRRVLRG